jgi:Bacteriophage replication gene A protein (GPA)
VIESEGAERITLWDAARSTVANKSHRRDELMTRIRGCEEWALDNGMVSMFTTNTAPSRYHSQRKPLNNKTAADRKKTRNPKYDGSTPAQAQAWLCETWARCRAQLHREGVKVYGFRVAEPHHDGCPHWHMLLWCKPEHYDKAAAAMRKHWLREPEFGSATNRLKIVMIDPSKGTAAKYIAKYIAKNIDDFGVSHHMDDAIDGEHGTDAVIESDDHPARRVDAWASTWRIRQFQAIGQPSVTVWRELRRTSKEAAAGGSDALIMAWLAVHRKGERMACWHSYMRAQGGAMRRRDDYRLTTHTIDKTTAGRYGETIKPWSCGVKDRALVDGAVTPTKRQRWGGAGFAVFAGVAAWTGLNNCTRARAANGKNLTPTLDAWREIEGKPLDDWTIDASRARHCDDLWSQIVVKN